MTLLLVATLAGLVLSAALNILAAIAAPSLKTEPSLTSEISVMARFDQQSMDATTTQAA